MIVGSHRAHQTLTDGNRADSKLDSDERGLTRYAAIADNSRGMSTLQENSRVPCGPVCLYDELCAGRALLIDESAEKGKP